MLVFARLVLRICVFVWACSAAVYSSRFNNGDRLGNSHQIIMGIEPAFPHVHIPLMQEGKTQMHFIFRNKIEFTFSIM